ncbi:MAG TPA: hypothetical protein VGZ00_05385 [Candidatus Baltobacteraceae bacterium]|nr:hypothetical protein [Candidatus Baltobacteraceae bacterium]
MSLELRLRWLAWLEAHWQELTLRDAFSVGEHGPGIACAGSASDFLERDVPYD